MSNKTAAIAVSILLLLAAATDYRQQPLIRGHSSFFFLVQGFSEQLGAVFSHFSHNLTSHVSLASFSVKETVLQGISG